MNAVESHDDQGASSAIEIEQLERDGVSVVAVAGEVDISNVARLREAAFDVENEALGIVLDLSAASFIDSATLSLIFELNHDLKRRRQGFRVVCAPGSSAERVLDLAALGPEARSEHDRDAAIDAIRHELRKYE
jgi:anti-sigma B factor antagonist